MQPQAGSAIETIVDPPAPILARLRAETHAEHNALDIVLPIIVVENSEEDFDTVEEAVRRSRIVADIRRTRTGDVDLLTYSLGRVVLSTSGGTT